MSVLFFSLLLQFLTVFFQPNSTSDAAAIDTAVACAVILAYTATNTNAHTCTYAFTVWRAIPNSHASTHVAALVCAHTGAYPSAFSDAHPSSYASADAYAHAIAVISANSTAHAGA
jgi:hypothetical protein